LAYWHLAQAALLILSGTRNLIMAIKFEYQSHKLDLKNSLYEAFKKKFTAKKNLDSDHHTFVLQQYGIITVFFPFYTLKSKKTGENREGSEQKTILYRVKS
jgi:hypothetical protein